MRFNNREGWSLVAQYVFPQFWERAVPFFLIQLFIFRLCTCCEQFHFQFYSNDSLHQYENTGRHVSLSSGWKNSKYCFFFVIFVKMHVWLTIRKEHNIWIYVQSLLEKTIFRLLSLSTQQKYALEQCSFYIQLISKHDTNKCEWKWAWTDCAWACKWISINSFNPNNKRLNEKVMKTRIYNSS